MLSSSSSLVRIPRLRPAVASRSPFLCKVGKGELAEKLSAKLEISKDEANRNIEGLISIIVDEVKKGEKVAIVGFGSWQKKVRAARDGRNPQTGQPLKIPEKEVPVFTASKLFRQEVSGVETPEDKPANKLKADNEPKKEVVKKPKEPKAAKKQL